MDRILQRAFLYALAICSCSCPKGWFRSVGTDLDGPRCQAYVIESGIWSLLSKTVVLSPVKLWFLLLSQSEGNDLECQTRRR